MFYGSGTNLLHPQCYKIENYSFSIEVYMQVQWLLFVTNYIEFVTTLTYFLINIITHDCVDQGTAAEFLLGIRSKPLVIVSQQQVSLLAVLRFC